MKLIFLDFDGVIFSMSGCIYARSVSGQERLPEYVLDPVALSLLEYLLDKMPEIRIVISSTWRLGHTIEQLQKILGEKIGSRVIGATPKLDGYRGHEIKQFLDNWNEFYRGSKVEDFVIIDDDRDMNPYMGHLIWTDSMNGFTSRNLIEVETYFKMKPLEKKLHKIWLTIKYNTARQLRSLKWKIFFMINKYL